MNCADFKAIGQSAIDDFDRRIATIPTDICAPFYEEAGRLEASILTVYKGIVLASKHLEDLNDVAKLWGCMVEVCDFGIRTLSKLVKDHPACGAEYYYDRLLDLRNRCLRLQNLHA